MTRHLWQYMWLAVFLTGSAALGCAVAADGSGIDPERLPYAKAATLAKLPDGRVIHIKCMGAGSPTVILTAGMGDWGVSWRKIQPAVAKSTRVCTWDRAGFGFSDGTTQVQLIANTASDLELALKSASIVGPYVLVGHSMGGLESVIFADRNRSAVVGMVLVDPSGPNQASRLRDAAPEASASIAEYRKQSIDNMRKCWAAVESGTLTIGSPDPGECLVYSKSYPVATAAALAQLDTNPSRWAAKISLMENFDASAASLANPDRRFGDIPLIVLTAGKLPTLPADLPASAAASIQKGLPDWAAEFNRMHDDLAALSTHGTNRHVAYSGHYIQYDKPDAVIAAINEVLQHAQKASTVTH